MNRREQIIAEAKYALSKIDSSQKRQLTLVFPLLFGRALTNRVDRLGSFVGNSTKFVYKELLELGSAVKNKKTIAHSKNVFLRLSTATKSLGVNSKHSLRGFIDTVKTNPDERIPSLIVGVLGFYTGSGGLDGDGGIPDLDLALGIENHRSLLTHSVIAGSLIEATVLSAVVLAVSLHEHLPDNHDPMWENLNLSQSKLIESLLIGTSAGLAYHFGIDATVDGGGDYANINGYPHEFEQTIMGANALSEGLNSGNFSLKSAFKGMDLKKVAKVVAGIGLLGVGLTW